MKIESFTDKIAERYGANDDKTIVDEGAVFIAEWVNAMQQQVQTKVPSGVQLYGSRYTESIIAVDQIRMVFRKYNDPAQIQVLVFGDEEIESSEPYDQLEVSEKDAVLMSTRFQKEFSKAVFEKYLDVFQKVV